MTVTAQGLLEEAESLASNPTVKGKIKTAMAMLWPSSPLMVGLNGLAGYGPAQQKIIEEATGITRDRLTYTTAEVPWLNEVVATGCRPIVILEDPSLAQPCAEWMKSKGLTLAEFRNEAYDKGIYAAGYGAEYAAARKTFNACGVKLIANARGDYELPNGEWSQQEAGRGWCVDMGVVPDYWGPHPYGPMTASGVMGGGKPSGWLSIPPFIEFLEGKGILAPVIVTEVGQPTWKGDDGNTPVTQAEQAADMKTYIEDAAAWDLTGIWIFGAMDPAPTGEGGYGIYTHELKAKPSAAALGEAVKAL